MSAPSLAEVRAAAERIRPFVRRTPLEVLPGLSFAEGRELWLKQEGFQITGSFKLRGAVAKLTALSQEERARGVLAVSAGNHGLAVAHAAGLLGISAVVVVPRSAVPAKVEAIRRYPVELVLEGEDYDQAERLARARAEASGRVFVSPYNDREVIAGQGTIALEMLEDQPELEAIVVAVGGGGLLAGMIIGAAGHRVKLYGAEPETSPTMLRALEAGRIVHVEEQPTLADGLAGNIEPDALSFETIRDGVAGVMLVSEQAIAQAIVAMAEEAHLLVEGSAAVALAALGAPALADIRKLGVVLSGRNIDLSRVIALASQRSA